MSDTAWRYEGSWRSLENTSAKQEGSIHDDAPARQLGFRGAFVPGSVVGACALPAILDRFGSRWFDGGWYDLKFVEPVYTTDRVRAIAEPAGDELACRVESRDERLCCVGRAGLGYSEPWSGFGGPPDLFPGAEVGRSFEPRSLEITRAGAAHTIDAGSDSSSLWEELIHPEHLMVEALHMVDWDLVPLEHVRAPGIWGQHAIKMKKALPYGRYRMSEHLAEKGSSGRTRFVCFEFRVTDVSGGEVAVGRHKCKFIRADL